MRANGLRLRLLSLLRTSTPVFITGLCQCSLQFLNVGKGSESVLPYVSILLCSCNDGAHLACMATAKGRFVVRRSLVSFL